MAIFGAFVVFVFVMFLLSSVLTNQTDPENQMRHLNKQQKELFEGFAKGQIEEYERCIQILTKDRLIPLNNKSLVFPTWTERELEQVRYGFKETKKYMEKRSLEDCLNEIPEYTQEKLDQYIEEHKTKVYNLITEEDKQEQEFYTSFSNGDNKGNEELINRWLNHIFFLGDSHRPYEGVSLKDALNYDGLIQKIPVRGKYALHSFLGVLSGSSGWRSGYTDATQHSVVDTGGVEVTAKEWLNIEEFVEDWLASNDVKDNNSKKEIVREWSKKAKMLLDKALYCIRMSVLRSMEEKGKYKETTIQEDTVIGQKEDDLEQDIINEVIPTCLEDIEFEPNEEVILIDEIIDL